LLGKSKSVFTAVLSKITVFTKPQTIALPDRVRYGVQGWNPCVGAPPPHPHTSCG
jgi:hypothetical protein